MNARSCFGMVALAGVGAVALLARPAQAQAAESAGEIASIPKTPAESSAGLNEIIVTAQRREESSQSVPISITAFSAERLQQQGITQAQDLQASVPSLVVGSNGQGSRDTQSFTVRGQGATFQASPGVVVYMNEVPLPAPITLSQQGGPGNYVDLENLQVLAGPQGTLFGRNTTGGAVLLVPRKPTNDLSGSLQTRVGNYEAREVEGVVNIPLIDDKLLIRAVGAYHDREGYTRDVVRDEDLDNKHWYSGRLGITFRPTDQFENYLLAYGAYSKVNGTGLIHKAFNIPGLVGVGFCVEPPLAPPGPSGIAVSCDYYRNLSAQADALGPRATAPGVDEGQKTETWGLMNTSTYNLTDGLTLRNIFSYQRFKSFYHYDGDGTVVEQQDINISASTLPRDYIKGYTEELQLQGNLLEGRLVFAVGGFYYDQKPAGEQGLQQVVYCPATFTGFCSPTFGSVAVRNTSKAAYAQATLDLGLFAPQLDGLRVTGGYRYTWDTIRGSAYSYAPLSTVPGSYICTNTSQIVASDPLAACSFGATLRSESPNWTVGLDYDLTDGLLLYAKVSRGYKSGGFNSYSVFPETRTFEPEYVTSYEAGFKSDFHLGSVPARLNSSFYFSDYTDIQRASGDYNPITNASGARIHSGEAEIEGVEVEATLRPVRGLEVGGTFSYTDFDYTKYQIASNGLLPDCSGSVPAPGSLADLKCLAGQYVSPYIYSLHAAVDQSLPGDLGALSLFVVYSHSAAQHTEASVVPPHQPGERLESFGLLNASLDWKNVGGSGFDAGLFITNATDERYRISNTDVYQTGALLSWATVYGEPRMYGLKLRYQFGVQ